MDTFEAEMEIEYWPCSKITDCSITVMVPFLSSTPKLRNNSGIVLIEMNRDGILA